MVLTGEKANGNQYDEDNQRQDQYLPDIPLQPSAPQDRPIHL